MIDLLGFDEKDNSIMYFAGNMNLAITIKFGTILPAKLIIEIVFSVKTL
ncbi:MAG: hypothetical protein IIC67_01470 [Thaumarchaeota archaeon]|nr:hypothetical protein [Nitrososphaerota archaeon]